MQDVTYGDVVRLAEQLTTEEQKALAAHLQQLAEQRELDRQERLTLFDSMIVDLGPVAPDFSFSREDWYGDDER